MKIGDLSTQANTPVETIRFYEREGLLPEPARTAGNYRIYDAGHVERLAFIRHCRSLDMALDEIRVLLRLKEDPSKSCEAVNQVLDEHIGHVAHRIQELKALQKQLVALRSQCSQERDVAHCGILSGLSQASAGTQVAHNQHVSSTHGRRR
ncbi:MAG: Cd(II)/Pb(II)-responsive transcriptional regulator [Pseudomonadota bacterium]|jgi:Cd(II)/Pb(II)-responsive transcriptional regulator